MHWIYKLTLISLVIISCGSPSTTTQVKKSEIPSDKILSNNYYKKYIRPIHSEVKSYIILFKEDACYTCFSKSLSKLLPKLKSENYMLYSSQNNIDTISNNFNLSKEVVEVIPENSNFKRQYFMRHELVLLKIDTIESEVMEFIPLTYNNINSLNLK